VLDLSPDGLTASDWSVQLVIENKMIVTEKGKSWLSDQSSGEANKKYGHKSDVKSQLWIQKEGKGEETDLFCHFWALTTSLMTTKRTV